MAVLLLVVSRNNALRADALASAQHKTRHGEPPGLSDAISVNTLFWKILVTRVNSFFCERRE
jgi:hypothetical protein